MPTKNLAQLKAWFRKGMYPTESNFIDFMDSFFHKTDDIIPISAVGTLAERLNRKLDSADADELRSDIQALTDIVNNVNSRINDVYIDLDIDTINATMSEIETKLEAFVLMEQLAKQSAQLLPLKMNLTYLARITLGNAAPQKIVAELLPSYQRPNLLFLGDGNAVGVAPSGDLTINKVGKSKIHVIPTTNTALYKTVEIEVVAPSIVNATPSAMLLVGNNIFIS